MYTIKIGIRKPINHKNLIKKYSLIILYKNIYKCHKNVIPNAVCDHSTLKGPVTFNILPNGLEL